MNIRKAEMKDIEKIAILIKQVSDLHYEARKDKFKSKELESIQQFSKNIINDEQSNIIVAEDGNIICRSSYI